jgi:hypothetical protein
VATILQIDIEALGRLRDDLRTLAAAATPAPATAAGGPGGPAGGVLPSVTASQSVTAITIPRLQRTLGERVGAVADRVSVTRTLFAIYSSSMTGSPATSPIPGTGGTQA